MSTCHFEAPCGLHLPAQRSRASIGRRSPLQDLKHSVRLANRQNASLRQAHKRLSNIITRSSAVDAHQASLLDQSEIEQSNTSKWEEFCRAASGEWEGCSASFNASGSPIPLPSNYVPDAYREWGQEIHDWQTQCSTLVEGSIIKSKLKRLMPTVGCEADAVAFTEEERVTDLGAGGQLHESFAADGSWSIPADFKGKDRTSAEHCFVLEGRKRIRIIQKLRRKEDAWELMDVEVVSERWEADYNGGKELAGCGGGVPGFATQKRLTPEDVPSSWLNSETHLSKSNGSSSSAREQEVLLPLNVWSKITWGEEEICLLAGCLRENEAAFLSQQHYQSGSLAQVALTREAA